MNSYDFSLMQNLDSHYIMPTYGPRPLLLEKGRGAYLYDSQGRRYLDFGSGIGVAAIGYGDRRWVKAVCGQAKALAHASNYYYSAPYILLAERLCNICNMEQVFFANSGAEANEGAIKLARKYSFDKYGKGRGTIICLSNSFHGRTITTLSATGQDVFHNYFFPFTEGFVFAPVNNFDALRTLVDDTVCAVMVEPIQGEGGVMPLEREFFRQTAQLCKEKDLLLICDEVQTGVGRTGRFLCSEWFDVVPDIVTLAKGLGGGLPIGAFICGKKPAGVLDKSSHGTTFGANPVVCAGALAVLDRVGNDGFMKTVERQGQYLVRKIRELNSPHIQEIRGKGLMLGITLEGVQVASLLAVLRQNGLLALAAKENLRLLPPLTVTKRQIDAAVEILALSLATAGKAAVVEE